jgi:hypothetical protein
MSAAREQPGQAGRTGVAMRAAYLALLAVTIAAVAVGGWLSARDFFVAVPNNLAFGFVTGTGSVTTTDKRQVRIYKATSAAAQASGLRADDIILSIEGRKVPAGASEQQIGDLMGEVKGPVATLVTRSVDGKVRTHRLPRQPDAWSVRIAGTGLTGWERSAVLFGADQLRLLLLVAAAILLYLRRPKDREALTLGAAFLLYCHFSGSGFWFWYALHLEPVQTAARALFLAFLLTALNRFPNGRFASRGSRLLVYMGIPALIGMAWAEADLKVLPAGLTSWAMLAVLAASGTGLILRYRSLPAGTERQQIKWAVAGFVGFILISAVLIVPRSLGLFFGADQGPVSFVSGVVLTTLASLLLPLGMLVSLLRYRLYDADAAITRSFAYALLTTSLMAIFAATEKSVEILGERYFAGNAAALSGGIAAGLAAILSAPIHHRVKGWAEQAFRKPLVTLRDAAPDRIADLRETATLKELAAAVLSQIHAGVRAERLAMIVGDDVVAARGLEKADVAAWRAGARPEVASSLAVAKGDPLFPVRLPVGRGGEEPVGTILVGRRPDGSIPAKEERQVLERLAPTIARAVETVRRREAQSRSEKSLRTRMLAELKRLGERIEKIEDRLSRKS